MSTRRSLAALSADRRGGVSLIAAGAVSALLSATALAVDVGSLYLAKRELQGAADAAALAAAARGDNAHAAAQSAMRTNVADAVLTDLTHGHFNRDAAADWETRFTPGAGGDAVRVTLEGRTPVFFARFLTGSDHASIVARATAARSNLAGFWIGSRLAALDAGLPNALLSALTGSHVGLSVMDYQALGAARIDLLRFSDALRTELDMEAATFDETLNGSAMLPQVLRAMAAVTEGAGAASALAALASGASNTPVDLSRLIDLGPMGTLDMAVEERELSIDAMGMLAAVAQVAGGARQLAVNAGATIPGLTATRIDLAIGERPQHSPWLAVTSDRDVVVRTAQTRLRIETQIAGGAAPLATVRVPLFVELASAEARLDAINCSGGVDARRVNLSVTPSVGRIAIAETDVAAFANFGQPVALGQAALVSVPLLSVRGFADVQLGGASAQSVSFTAADIADHRVKTVQTSDIAAASLGSLIGRTQLSVNGIALPIGGGAVTPILTGAAPAIDGLLGTVLDVLGVGLGEADVGVSRMRCGVPMLVG